MAKEHIEYLEMDLDTWSEFYKSHRLLAEAMTEVLKDAKLLEAINEILKEKPTTTKYKS